MKATKAIPMRCPSAMCTRAMRLMAMRRVVGSISTAPSRDIRSMRSGAMRRRHFRSVIAFGRVHLIEKREEKLKALRLLGLRYREEDDEMLAKEIESGIDRVAMIEFCIERFDGKEARELVRDRKAASA